MKYLNSISITALLLLFISCTNDAKDNQLTKHTTVIKNFDEVGIVHNNGLDFIFSEETLLKLKTYNKGEDGVDTDAIATLIMEQTNTFLEGKTLEFENTTVALSPIESVDTFLQVYNNPELGIYTPCSGTAEEVTECINSIMNDYLAHPEREDYTIVMSTGALYKHSVAYWSSEENRKADFTAFQHKGWFNWVSCAIADAQGAWGGAEIGAVGGPAGAIGGAVAVGLMSSAYNSAIQAAVHGAQQ